MLARILATAAELRTIRARRELLERESEALKRQELALAQDVLPQLMDEAGVPYMGLDDDTRLERTEAVYASISGANANDATVWLEKNGYGAVIKSQFVVPVEKGDTKLMAHIRRVLEREKIMFDENSSVHPKTLQSLVRERLEQGKPVPPCITYHKQPVVVLKAEKKKRAAATPRASSAR